MEKTSEANFLFQVPHLQDKGFDLQSHLEKQAQTLCRQDSSSLEELYPVPVAPPIVEERSDGPAAKRLRGDGCGDSEVRCWENYLNPLTH